MGTGISRKDFEEGNFKTYRGASLKIIELLRANRDTAYTSKEIAETVGVSQVSVSIALRSMAKANLIEIRKPYYILKTSATKKKPIKKEEEESEEESTEEDTEVETE